MPATIQKILKPSKYRAVDTSGNNNHGQIYSGRGLEFDGAVDYLTGPTVAQGFTDLSYTKNFTVACWLKIDSLEDAGVWAMGQNDNDRVGLTIGADGEIAFTAWDSSDYTHASGGAEGSKAIEVNTWYRVICTMSPTNTKKLYINGVLQTGTSQAFGSPLSSINTQLYIGRTGLSATGYLGMKMSDFQVWNSTWTQSDVTFDYLNPESLALSNGGTSLTESNLKLWYPMQDGHRGQQSYIMDGANTGLGDELISDISASAWTKGSAGGSVDASTTITDNADGSVTFETAEASDWQTVSVPFVNENGVTYKISITGEALAETDGDNDDKFYWRIGSSVNNGHNTENINTSWMISEGAHTETNYFSSNVSTGTAYFIGMFKKASNTVHKFRLDSVSIKAVNQKHHATTVFHGEELTAEGDFENAGSAWSTSGSTITATKNTGAFVSTGDADGGFSTCSQSETLTAGRTYKLQFDVTAVTGSPTVHNYCGALNKSLLTASVATFTDTFVASSADASEGGIDVRTICANGESVTIDNISFKEVGVASGWTDADQQLHIAQTALQSYNQLAWFAGAGSDQGATLDSTINTTTTDWSMSFWIFKQENNEPFDFFMGSSTTKLFAFDNNANRKLYYRDDTGSYHSISDNEIPDNQWVHIVITVDGNTSMTAYVNGEVQETDSGMTGTALTLDRFMNGYSSNQYETRGCITEIAYFANRQIGQTNVNQLYNDGKAYDARNINDASYLTHYWRNDGLAEWKDLVGSNDINCNATETLLLPAGVDTSRDTQGFLMNRQKTTNSLNLHGILSSTSDTGAYGDVGDQPSLDFGTNNFSVSFWFKLKSDDIKMSFVGKQDSSSGWYLYYDADSDKISFYHRKDNKYTHGTTNPSVDRWYHCCFTRNGATGKIYLDSVDDTASTQDISADLDSSGDLFEIGRRNLFTADDRYLDGQIDDVLIYNDVLSADEVERVYNAGKRSHK